MADKFKKQMNYNTGPGGMGCSCCNCYFGKDKNRLNKLARTQINNDDMELFKDGINEFEESK